MYNIQHTIIVLNDGTYRGTITIYLSRYRGNVVIKINGYNIRPPAPKIDHKSEPHFFVFRFYFPFFCSSRP